MVKKRYSTKSLSEYAKEWEGNAEADALWVILTDSTYYGRKWGIDDFFATGEEEIQRVFSFMKQESITFPSDSFLDFGCGVGRNSKALRRRFKRGYGVDISERMIELAQGYVPDVKFTVNQKESLEQFESNSIDFVYSHIVLQHIPNKFKKKYIDEFLRILSPGGLAVIQIPIEVINPQKNRPPLIFRIKKGVRGALPFIVTLKRWLIPPKRFSYEFKYEMHPMSDDEMRCICEIKGCIIEAAPATNSCEKDHNGRVEFYDLNEHRKTLESSGLPNCYLSCTYFVRKSHTTSS
jgi:ubiquinone/menaquinone biosynthesis C-methylase UbiE